MLITRPPEITSTIQNLDLAETSSTHVCTTLILLIEEGIAFESEVPPPFYSPVFSFFSLGRTSWWNRCPRRLDRPLAFSLSSSLYPSVSFRFFSSPFRIIRSPS
jgi:hypothetical protein